MNIVGWKMMIIWSVIGCICISIYIYAHTCTCKYSPFTISMHQVKRMEMYKHTRNYPDKLLVNCRINVSQKLATLSSRYIYSDQWHHGWSKSSERECVRESVWERVRVSESKWELRREKGRESEWERERV